MQGSLKNGIATLNVTLLAYFSPIYSLVMAILLLISLDWVTGIWAAFKIGQPITSFKLRRTLTKTVVYSLAIITGLVFEKEMVKFFAEGLYSILGTNFQETDFPIVKIIALYIGATEFKSIIENLNKVYKLPFFKAIMDKLQPLQDDANNTIVEAKLPIVASTNKTSKKVAKRPKRKGKS